MNPPKPSSPLPSVTNQPIIKSPIAHTTTVSSNNLPPVPARPRPVNYSNYDAMNSMNNYGMYNQISPFSNPMMSGFGMNNFGLGYNGLGFNRMAPYGAYGSMAVPESDLIRLAEERSRTAFQSIESFVHAFQSISMMLESSYMALASSFRAVLGVAEHFSRLRVQIGSMITGFALFRTLLEKTEKSAFRDLSTNESQL